MQTNLRKLKHIHIIPLTGTKLLPGTAEAVSIPGRTPGTHRAETFQVRRCIGFLLFDSQKPEERLE